MRLKLSGAMLLSIPLIISNQVYGWNYLKDLKFNPDHLLSNSWISVDYRYWNVKATDKWKDSAGGFFSKKFLSKHFDKYLSKAIVDFFEISKEYEDAYRKGRMPGDIFTDFSGLFSSIYGASKYKDYVSMTKTRKL